MVGTGSTPLAHPLAVIRHRHGWSYQDLVAAIAAQAARMPEVGHMAARREKAWRWEHWGVVPDAGTQRALAALLGIDPVEVERIPWPHWLPAGDPIDPRPDWGWGGFLAALDGLLAVAESDVRGYLVLTGAPLRQVVHRWSEGGSTTGNPGGGDAGAGDAGGPGVGSVVEPLAARLRHLRQLDDRLGGVRLQRLVDAELQLLRQLLRDTGTAAAHAGALSGVAAELAQLGGSICAEAGLHGAAQRYYVTGLRGSRCAGDRLLGAALLAAMSAQALDAGALDDAVHLAETAAANTDHRAPPRARALIGARLAVALARAGERAGADAALAAAREALAAVTGADPEPSWSDRFGAAALAASAGECWLALGEAATATGCFVEALRLRDPADRPDHARYLFHLAAARLRLGETDAAIDALREGMALAGDGCSPRGLRLARSLRDQLPSRERRRLDLISPG